MTTHQAPAPRSTTELAVDVLGLDDEAVLASIVAHRARVRAAESGSPRLEPSETGKQPDVRTPEAVAHDLGRLSG